MEEIWKPIVGYEKMYAVSNLGRVKRLSHDTLDTLGRVKHWDELILKTTYNERLKYVQFNVGGYDDKPRTMLNLHRVVAQAFCENDAPAIKLTVNHKDGNRKNNEASNLEWASYSENLLHSYKKLHRPTNRAQVQKRGCYIHNKTDHTTIKCESIAEASRQTKLSETQIRRLIDGECVNETYFVYQ